MIALRILRELWVLLWARLTEEHRDQRGEVPSWVVLVGMSVTMAVAVVTALTVWVMNRVHNLPSGP